MQSGRVAVVTAKGLDVLGKHVMSVCRIEERARNVRYTAPEFNPKSDTLLLHETVPTATFQSIALPLFSHSFLLYSSSSHFPSFIYIPPSQFQSFMHPMHSFVAPSLRPSPA